MNLTCFKLGLALEIDERLIQELIERSRKYYPHEFGGLLIGRYSKDFRTCYIEGNIFPIEYKSSRYGFERGKKGIMKKLTEYYNSTPKRIYLGEWHTHPDGSPTPSQTDLLAMQQIANDKKVNIRNPILLILGITKDTYTLGVFVQFQNRLYKYEQE